MVNEIIRRERALRVFLAKFDLNISKAEIELLVKVLAHVEKLPIKDGILIDSIEAIDVINELDNIIKKHLLQGKYNDSIKDLIKNFNEVEQSSILYHGLLTDVVLDGVGDKIGHIKEALIDDISTSLASAPSFKVNITNVIKRELNRAVLFGSKQSEVRSALTNLIIQDDLDGGLLRRYTKQIAHDSLFFYSGSIEGKIGEEIKANARMYVGPLVEKSRPQCIRWITELNGIIPDSKIESEITWAKENGKGYSSKGKPYYEELTPENFDKIRGGFNCGHLSIRVRLTDKTKDRLLKVKKVHEKALKDTIKKEEQELKNKNIKLYKKYLNLQ